MAAMAEGSKPAQKLGFFCHSWGAGPWHGGGSAVAGVADRIATAEMLAASIAGSCMLAS